MFWELNPKAHSFVYIPRLWHSFITWWEETVQIFQEKNKITLHLDLFLEPMSSHMFFMVQKCVWIVPFISSLGSKGEQPLWYLQQAWKETPGIFHQGLFLWVFWVSLHGHDSDMGWVIEHRGASARLFQLYQPQWWFLILISQWGL